MTAAQGEGLRERKKREAREAIVATARRLFAERPFDEVTVDEIARHANVSRRTFFRYFPTKEDVFFDRRRTQLAHLEEELARRLPGETAYATVRRALLAVAEGNLVKKREVVAENLLVARTPALLARDLEWDRRAQELVAATLGRGGDEERAGLVAGAIVGAVRVVVERWVASRGRRDLLADGAFALDLFADLAATPSRPG